MESKYRDHLKWKILDLLKESDENSFMKINAW